MVLSKYEKYPYVICVSGKAGAGKDTYARFLAEELEVDGHSVLIVHYADLLKFVCKQFFDWDGEKDEYGRWLLQYVGTDLVRKRDKNLWADVLMRLLVCLKDFGEWDYIIIPDTRFENEINVVKAFFFPLIHIRIEREEYDSGLTEEQKNHQSEMELDDAECDYVILNDGGLEELRNAAATTVEAMNGFHQMTLEDFFCGI